MLPILLFVIPLAITTVGVVPIEVVLVGLVLAGVVPIGAALDSGGFGALGSGFNTQVLG